MIAHFVQSPLLRSVPGFYHAFGGVDPVRGRGAGERLRQLFFISPASIRTLRQVHSAEVLESTPEDAGFPDRGGRSGDGLWTTEAGTGVGVRTADCVPVLLAHPGVPLAAAIHVGWRGLAAGIVGEAVRVVESGFGGRVRDGLVAAVGPAAKGCCYEVGDDVYDLLAAMTGGERHMRRTGAPGKWTADIQALTSSALAASGVSAGRIEAVGPCTVCSSRFHSYRREKTLTGRQLSFIYIL